MVTTLYLHAAASNVVGTLPNTKQSALTANDNMDPLTTNRTMNTTIGVSQTSIEKAMAFTTSDKNFYVSRWVSPPLSTTSISANTWTVSDAAKESNYIGYFPISKNSSKTQNCLYLWRPSTGAKVNNIFDAVSATTTAAHGTTSEKTNTQTYTGAARTAAVGDVLIFEFWATTTSDSNATITATFYYDGTTANTADNVAVTNHASSISTPQNLVFITSIDAISTYQTITNKFITIV